jgi:hypothetical protein
LGTALNDTTLSAIEGRSTAPTKMETIRPRESGAARRFVMSAIAFRSIYHWRTGFRPRRTGSRLNDVTG